MNVVIFASGAMMYDSEGNKIRINKLTIDMTLREIWRDMIQPVEEGGCAAIRNPEGTIMLSESIMRWY